MGTATGTGTFSVDYYFYITGPTTSLIPVDVTAHGVVAGGVGQAALFVRGTTINESVPTGSGSWDVNGTYYLQPGLIYDVHLSASFTASATGLPDCAGLCEAFGSAEIDPSFVIDPNFASANDYSIIFSPGIGVASGNMPPVANAGPNQTFDIKSGATVQLNGSGSTDDNTPTASLVYQWIQLYGNTVTLTGANTETPSFIPPAIGTYIFGLVVTDNGTPPLSSATPTLAAGATSCVPSAACVMVSAYNQPPSAVATAFPTIAYVKETVTLNGTGSSDPEGDAITFAWSLTCSPTGSKASLASITKSTTSIIPDVPGIYAATLTVTDNFHSLFHSPSLVQPCPTPLPSVQSPQQTTVTFVADTAQLFAVTQIVSANTLVSSLVATQVTTSGNQTAFGNFLSQAVTAIQAGKTADAITKLNNAIQRTNGCAINSPPAPDGPGPGMDWVTDCAVQTSLLAYLNAALSALTAP
jgi:hypothetical protein